MLLGPFIRREWVTSIRSRRVFAHRRNALMILAVFVAVTFLIWDWRKLDRASISGASRFGNWLFGVLLLAEAALAFHVVSPLGPSIAAERDRKSLDALLATRLSGAEIVLGNLAGGLLRCLNSMAATIPVVLLVVLLGGIDPWLVFLAFACLASMTFSLAALSVAVSAVSRTAAHAINATTGFYMGWLTFPWLFVVLKPILWPAGPAWLVAAALWLVDGSPMGLWMNIMGVIPRPGGLEEAVSWLVGWQIVAGLALITWAIARLRPASRAVYDREGRTSRLGSIRAALCRARPRPPCGDDPVLWNDLYTFRAHGRLARLAGWVFGLVALAALVVVTSWFAGPAFVELRGRGYSASPEARKMPEFQPLVRVLVSKLILKTPLAPESGQARLEFNIALRQFSALVSVLVALGVLAAVSRSVTTERRRDTWSGLIATPLTGREILGAKMLASLFSARDPALLLVGLWSIGLAAGAVHPLGFVAALISLVVYGGLAATLGAANLDGRHVFEADYPGSWSLRLMGMIGMLLVLPLVTPFLAYASLLSYEDARSLVDGGPFFQFTSNWLRKWAGAREVMALWSLSTIALGMLAMATARAAFHQFDAAVGRPTRPEPTQDLGISESPVLAETAKARSTSPPNLRQGDPPVARPRSAILPGGTRRGGR